MKTFWQTLLAALGGAAAYLWGPFDALLIALIAAVALDYVTGVANAVVHKQLSSAVGINGVVKKALVFIVVGLASALDRLMLDANGAVRAAVCLFYIANEGLSVLENAASCGLPLPEALKSILAQLRDGK